MSKFLKILTIVVTLGAILSIFSCNSNKKDGNKSSSKSVLGNKIDVLFSFDEESGMSPVFDNLLKVNDSIYIGTTNNDLNKQGTIFEYNNSNNTVKKIFNFDMKGVGGTPYSNMIKAYNGIFYGTCALGGKYNKGTLYSFNYEKNDIQKIIDFNGSYNGGVPMSRLFEHNKKLYGTTKAGGKYGKGTLFEFDIETKKMKVLNEFFDQESGAYPVSGVFMYKDKLYGTTSSGGDFDQGTIYEYDLEKNKLTILYSFEKDTGFMPWAGLPIQFEDGYFYGCTPQGGAQDLGVLYRFNLESNKYEVLFEFDYEKGANPYGYLVNYKNKIVGTSSEGGIHNDGTIFQFDPINNKFSIIYSFDGEKDGSNSSGSLLYMEKEQVFIGYTREGGSNNGGTLFKIKI